jgi:hypothetical protein
MRLDKVVLGIQRKDTVNENGSSLMERMSWLTRIQ